MLTKNVYNNSMTQRYDFAQVLGYLGQYQGKRLVFKIGGETVDNPDRLSMLARQILMLSHFGIQCVLVHGGGKQLTAAQEEAGIIKRTDNDGDRITDAKTLKITKQVMRQLNETILDAFTTAETDLFNAFSAFDDCQRYGMRDLRHPLLAYAKVVEGEEENFTGIPTGTTNLGAVEALLSKRGIPVLSCLAQSDEFDGTSFNVNGDRAAVAIATGLRAERLVFVTDVPGVMSADRQYIFSKISTDQAQDLIKYHVAVEGMAMKLEMAKEAINQNVIKAVILQQAGSTLQELLTETGKGTLVVHNQKGLRAPVVTLAPK